MAAIYRNLKAEQARQGFTNEQMAQFLGMSRGNYEAKLRNGRFYANEALVLCKIFNCGFDYLFATDDESRSAG